MEICRFEACQLLESSPVFDDQSSPLPLDQPLLRQISQHTVDMHRRQAGRIANFLLTERQPHVLGRP